MFSRLRDLESPGISPPCFSCSLALAHISTYDKLLDWLSVHFNLISHWPLVFPKTAQQHRLSTAHLSSSCNRLLSGFQQHFPHDYSVDLSRCSFLQMSSSCLLFQLTNYNRQMPPITEQIIKIQEGFVSNILDVVDLEILGLKFAHCLEHKHPHSVFKKSGFTCLCWLSLLTICKS